MAAKKKTLLTISKKETPLQFLQRNSITIKGVLRINELLTETVAATTLPFTEKTYHAFCDKHLSKKIDDLLFLDENDTYFREITTDYDSIKYFAFFKSFFRDPVFCDIGCGIGNLLYFGAKMGYIPFGYELNTDLQPVHKKIKADVVYGDVLQASPERLQTAHIIYMYRPINNNRLMNSLLRKIHKHTKEDVMVFYNYPHSYKIAGFNTLRLGIYDADMILLTKK